MTRSQRDILLDLSTDLRRASYNRWQFLAEAEKRYREILKEDTEVYFQNILQKLEKMLTAPPADRTAEDALMYSTLIKNYALHRMQQ